MEYSVYSVHTPEYTTPFCVRTWQTCQYYKDEHVNPRSVVLKELQASWIGWQQD